MMFRENKTADLFDEIRTDCFQAMERVGEAVRDEWQSRVSVPVEYVAGPRGGVVVVRSLPGEPPRKETGELHDSIQAATESDADVLTTTVDSEVPHAAYTNEGTARMAPRPHAPDLDDACRLPSNTPPARRTGFLRRASRGRRPCRVKPSCRARSTTPEHHATHHLNHHPNGANTNGT
jgi:hypothetical protein